MHQIALIISILTISIIFSIIGTILLAYSVSMGVERKKIVLALYLLIAVLTSSLANLVFIFINLSKG